MSSTRLSNESYLAHIRDESARFLEVLRECDPTALVPSCPAWTASDLLWHLTEVQHFWTHVIRTRPSAPEDYAEPVRPATYADLLTGFAAQTAEFTDVLAAADPSEPAWGWSVEQTVGFSYRRQAHEALIHRVDAELAAGLPNSVDALLAADGLEEVLDIFYGGKPAWGTFSGLPHYLRVDTLDTDHSIWIQLGRLAGDKDGEHVDVEDFAVVSDPGVEPDAVINGTAADLCLRVWRRADGANTHLTGDHAIIDHFRQLIHAPLD